MSPGRRASGGHWAGLALAAVALWVTACSSTPATAPATTARSPSTTSTTSTTQPTEVHTVSRSQHPPWCQAVQLRVGFFASSDAAGTAVYGVSIVNSRKQPCTLRGIPSIIFRGKHGVIAVKDVYSGPGSLFPGHPSWVALRRATPFRSDIGIRYPPISAGFVITSTDVHTQGCRTVTSIWVALPGILVDADATHYFVARVPQRGVVASPYRLCGPPLPPQVGVSAVVSRQHLIEAAVP